MKSFFGSKAASGLCQNIIAMMPPHHTYIESHLGGGGIMKRKPAALKNIGIDLDARVLSGFDCEYPVELVQDSAHRFLRDYDYREGVLVYADPPYLNRTSERTYRFDYAPEDHIELLSLLKSLPCQVILSGYPSVLYDEWLGDWNSVQLQAMCRGGVRTEQLWFNYTVDRAHWARYGGRNFTDRQRIKRKAESWGRRYQALPAPERLAVLGAMMAVQAQGE